LSIDQTVESLGIDVVIDFEGIQKITDALQQKIQTTTSQKIFTITPEIPNLDLLKKLLDEIKNKLINLPKNVKVEELKEEIANKEKKARPAIQDIDKLMSKSPTASNLLTEVAIKGIERILKTSLKEFELEESDFSKLNLDDAIIKKMFGKLGTEDARKLAKEEYEENADTILKEMEKIKQTYDKKKIPLTPTTMVDLLRREQRKQRNAEDSPFYVMNELGLTIEEFRKNATEKIDEIIREFVGGKSTEDFVDKIDKQIDKIDVLIEKNEKKVLSLGKKEVVKDIGNRIKNILTNLKMFGTDIPDEEKGRELTEKLYNLLLKESVIPIDIIKLTDELSKDLADADTIGNLVSLKLGDDLVEIILKNMKKVVEKDTMQKYMNDTVKKGFSKISSTAVADVMGEVAGFLGQYLIDYTEIENSAKLFKDEYLPYLNEIKTIFKQINVEGAEGIQAITDSVRLVKELGGIKSEKRLAKYQILKVSLFLL